MTVKITVTGSTGMLGKEIVKSIKKNVNFKILALSRHASPDFDNVKYLEVDLADSDRLKGVLDEFEPEIIVHCAAMVNVDECEKSPDLAFKTNCLATQIIANYKPRETRVIYISTDSVFDGNKGNYSEMDAANPLNFYAETKLRGEKILEALVDNLLIIRTNIYGFHLPPGKSLAEWALNELRSGRSVNGFVDIFFNPVYTGQLADIIVKTMQFNIRGVLNVGANQHISKYDFLDKLAGIFNFDKKLIVPISTDDFNFQAKRPKNTTLNVEKLKKLLYTVPDLDEGLREFKKDYDLSG